MKKPGPNRITVTGDDNPNALNGTAGDDLLQGLGGNDILNGLGGIDRTEGGLGDDWHYVDNAADMVVELTGEGNDRVFASVSYTLGAGQSVETFTTDNNTGTTAIDLTGNELVNEIYGNMGSNVLDGGGGSDILHGGGGLDSFQFSTALGPDNVDLLYDLDSTLLNGQLDYVLLDNRIFAGLPEGVLANDAFASNGSPVTASTRIIWDGGTGKIFFDQDGSGAAFDPVLFAIRAPGYGSGLHADHFVVYRGAPSNTITGDGDNNTLDGSAGDDLIQGLGGNDILNGLGGIDTTEGGTGDDWHYVDNAGDLVTELAGEGNDRVLAGVSYQLHAGASVETLSSTSDSGTDAITLLGNELVQTIYGNAGSNFIDGNGGADILAGLAGDDTYVVTADDTVLEQAAGGTDSVRVNGDSAWVATAGSEIEVIRVTNGTGAINTAGASVTGNALAQTIYGDGRGNIIDGGGGGDILYGLDPANSPGQTDFTGDNDQFYVVAGDQVIERANEGSDRVYARTSYTLTAGSSIELFTTDNNTATTAINLTGNELAQAIYGNDGDNVIDGGSGNDDLYGRAGADGFAFTSALGPGNVDRINDFVIGTDHILLGDAVFGLAVGALTASAFRAGTAAQDADDRIIYDQATGKIYFDEDGNGATFGNVQFAVVSAGLALSASDFTVIAGGVGPNVVTGDGGDNVLTGTAGSDLLQGLGGNDVLYGLGGSDRTQGGTGDDWHYVDSANDTVEELAGEGNDRVLASTSYTLAAGVSVELLTTEWNTNKTAINLTGNELANIIYGNDGNNFLDGGGGADVLAGRLGNDFFYVDNAGDYILEATNEGTDRVFASVSYVLTAGASVERFTTDNNIGTSAINLTGNALHQEIYGNNGANVLDSGGGGDQLFGNGGDDRYFVSTGDTVTDSAGFDRVFARSSFSLVSNSGVELLTTADHIGTAAINLTGDSGVQDIYGNDGDNVIGDGGGHSAWDNLFGNGGNDTFIIRALPQSTQNPALTRVYEALGDGFDTVQVNGPGWIATPGSEIEVIRALNSSGYDAKVTGNEFAQTIFGNASANIIDGGGGDDILYGNNGTSPDIDLRDNDQFYVDAGDHVFENPNEGFDRVWARTSFTLDAGSSVELFTTYYSAHTEAFNLTGNDLYQAIYGNDGDNVIDGKGASDELIGRAGADSFAFTSALGPDNVDGVYDFIVGTDRILLDDAIFTGLATGALASSAFVAGTAAQDADDRIIFDQATGRLWFDQDGNGTGFAAIQFAFVDDGQTLTAIDFSVI